MTVKRKDQPLKVEIIDGVLSISIGVGTLRFSAEHAPGPPLTWYDDESEEFMKYGISDEAEFAKDVLRELLHEREDGATPVHILLDQAMWKAIENGSLGVDEEPSKWELK